VGQGPRRGWKRCEEAELRALDPGDPQYREKFEELRESVEEHIGEEEDKLLPEALEVLGDELDRLSAQMQERKEQLMASTR
jgi:hemerythrin-like domain-containing protein